MECEHAWKLAYTGKISEMVTGTFHCERCDEWKKEQLDAVPKDKKPIGIIIK